MVTAENNENNTEPVALQAETISQMVEEISRMLENTTS